MDQEAIQELIGAVSTISRLEGENLPSDLVVRNNFQRVESLEEFQDRIPRIVTGKLLNGLLVHEWSP